MQSMFQGVTSLNIIIVLAIIMYIHACIVHPINQSMHTQNNNCLLYVIGCSSHASNQPSHNGMRVSNCMLINFLFYKLANYNNYVN